MKIHPFTIVYLLFAFYFRMSEYLVFLLFSLLHETGHYLLACYFDFEIDHIEVLPFGAFLSLKDFGRHLVKEELLMLCAGPLVNMVFIVLFYFMGQSQLLKINVFIALFNLLPIYPLDGAKICQLMFSYFMDYRYTFFLQIRISLLLIAFGFLSLKALGRLIVLFYLFYHNILYIKEYRISLIETILADHYHKKKMKVHHQLKYYRPYDNYYLINGQIYDFETVKINLIKSMKSH